MILNKKKSIFLTLLLTLTFVGAFSILTPIQVHAATYNEVENNNYFSNADTISMSGANTFNGSFSTSDDIDFVKFTITKGSAITLTVKGEHPKANCYSLGMTYYLYDANKTREEFYYGSAIYNGNYGYMYKKDTLYLSPGTYYMKLFLQIPTDNLKYSLTFNSSEWENVSEPNDNFDQASKITLSKTYYGMINSFSPFRTDNESDFFKHYASEKGYYYATLRNVNIPGTKAAGDCIGVEAYDINGNYRSIFNGKSYLNVEKGKGSTVKVYLPKGTTYFKLDSGNAGKYKFSLTKMPSKVTNVSVAKSGKSSLKIKWSKKSNVTGYKIYRSTKKNSGYSLIKTIKSNSITSYLDKNKKKGRTYYYKVKAYSYVNGYSCSGYYSNIVSKKR